MKVGQGVPYLQVQLIKYQEHANNIIRKILTQ